MDEAVFQGVNTTENGGETATPGVSCQFKKYVSVCVCVCVCVVCVCVCVFLTLLHPTRDLWLITTKQYNNSVIHCFFPGTSKLDKIPGSPLAQVVGSRC